MNFLNTMDKLVSVIIPVYNHENYVQDTIKSVIKQSYNNIELLIIDDGSNDKSSQQIIDLESQCKERFSNYYFERQENKGLADTLNKLVSRSRGDYIAIIASDDQYANENTILNEVNFLENNNDYALVCGINKIINSDNEICYWDENQNLTDDKNKAFYSSFSDYLESVSEVNFDSDKFGSYASLYISNHVPNGYVIRKSIFELIGNFTNKAPLEDYWLMLQISKFAKMKFLRIETFLYRWHDSNTVKNFEKVNKLQNLTLKHESEILLKEDSDKYLKSFKIFKKQYLSNSFYLYRQLYSSYLKSGNDFAEFTRFLLKKSREDLDISILKLVHRQNKFSLFVFGVKIFSIFSSKNYQKLSILGITFKLKKSKNHE